MGVTFLIPAVVFIGVLAAIYAGTSIASRRPSAEVRRRLDDHRVTVEVTEAKRLERINVLKQQTFSRIRLANAILSRFKPARTAVRELVSANVKLTVTQYLLARVIFAAAVFFAVRSGLDSALLALPAGVFGLMLPRIVVRIQARRRRTAFEAQLAETIDLLVGALRSGHGFLQAIEAASRDITEPMSGELERVIEEVNLGVNPVDALQAITTRIESYDFALLATAVSVQRSVGGNLAEVMENIADTVRERRRVRGEVHALTTGPRVSSYVLCLIPIGLLFAFSLINSDYREVMFYTPIGKLMIGFSTVWSLIGLFLSQKVAKVEY